MAIDVLVVDDERDIRELVSGILEDNGYTVRTASNYTETIQEIANREPSIVILDVWLGDGSKDGVVLLNTIMESHAHVPVIMMSGHSTIETAVEAIKHGAYDFIEKPFESERLLISVERALEMFKLRFENETLKAKAGISDVLIGDSNFVRHLRSDIERLSTLSSRCFINGPLGSDREGIARAIHNNSNNSESVFLTINCQTYNQKQLEIELFGADIRTNGMLTIKSGAFERVGDGTIYFEEITSLNNDLQQKILKAVKNNTFTRIGGQLQIPLKSRIICGSSIDVNKAIDDGTFIGELYTRLSTDVIDIVPLRNRGDDIPVLVKHFVEQAVTSYNVRMKNFTEQAMFALISYDWPGDVLQLKNLVEWVFYNITPDKTVIDINDLPTYLVDGEKDAYNQGSTRFIASVADMPVKTARDTFEREYFISQLKKFGGSITKTANFVGMERSALHRKLKSLGIQTRGT